MTKDDQSAEALRKLDPRDRSALEHFLKTSRKKDDGWHDPTVVLKESFALKTALRRGRAN